MVPHKHKCTQIMDNGEIRQTARWMWMWIRLVGPIGLMTNGKGATSAMEVAPFCLV